LSAGIAAELAEPGSDARSRHLEREDELQERWYPASELAWQCREHYLASVHAAHHPSAACGELLPTPNT